MEGGESIQTTFSWPTPAFDPLSSQEEAQLCCFHLTQHTNISNSSTSNNNNNLVDNNKVLAFSTLNLNPNSMSPFDLNIVLSPTGEIIVPSQTQPTPNINNITRNETNGTTPPPLLNSSSGGGGSTVVEENENSSTTPRQTTTTELMNVTFLALDPVSITSQDEEEDDDVGGQSIRIPKPLQEIGGGGGADLKVVDVNVVNVVEDEEEAIYFNIHDLDQYADDDDRDKGYLIEDLIGEGAPAPEVVSPPFFHQQSRTLDVNLLEEDEDEEEEDLRGGRSGVERRNSSSCSTTTTTNNDFEGLMGDDDFNDEDDDTKDDFSTTASFDEFDTSTSTTLLPPNADKQGLDILIVDGEEKQELKCKFCGFICCSKSSLGIHERRHTGERPYACKYCGRLFNSAQCCKHHERLHTGDKPFECQYCGKKYAVSTRLKRHERVHTREEPYKCTEPGCGKTFRWFDAFRDHRNTHNGVPLYLCSVCGKSFTSYLKFYYHERGHFLKRERDRDRQLRKQQQLQSGGGGVSSAEVPATTKKTKNQGGGGRGAKAKNSTKGK